MNRTLLGLMLVAVLVACAEWRPPVPDLIPGHLSEVEVAAEPDIPAVVAQAPFVPEPEVTDDDERYTVVVNRVPVRELLFALARDAKINVDIDDGVEGVVSLNAIDQTFPQILDRVARQTNVRYEVDGDSVFITPDTPYFHIYDVGYVNVSRDTDTVVNVATRVATTGEGAADQGGGGGGASNASNTSATRVSSRSYNRFWETLYGNIVAILDEETDTGGGFNGSTSVVANAEAGVITVLATAREHVVIQSFIDRVLRNANRQVMIEVTIVEVRLFDQYQAGVDWQILLTDADKESGFVNQSLLGAITDGAIDNAISSTIFGYVNPDADGRFIDVTVRLLHEYGDTTVISSPRMMVLNNQTAMIKVVEELVYFSLDVTDKDSTATQQGRTIIDSEIFSVPVGLVMALTPQISDNSEITLTIRPSISQKVGDALDPAIQIVAESLGAEGVSSAVPIIRTRELESVLRLTNGQVAVLGGLMQDDITEDDRVVPGLSKLPFIGELFFDTQETVIRKSELIIFLRPTIVENPSLETDLKDYRQFLSSNKL
jgi:general secretion pathway protein D